MLTSWKAIAAFFDRDVRTVQRWEKDEGLPVHRHLHRRQSSVYAHPAELDGWWARRGHSLPQPTDSSSADVAPEPAPPSEALPPQPLAPGSGPTARAAGWGRWWPAIAAVPLLILGGVWAVTGVRPAPADPDARGLLAALDYRSPLGPGPVADINGDGVADLTMFSHADGVAFLVFGDRSPMAGDLAGLTNVRILTTDNTTIAIGSARDYDGDGLVDLVLTTLAREPDTFHRTGAGYLLRGRRSWPAELRLPADADVTFAYAEAADIRLDGCPVDKRTDLNGDGLDDIVLGAADYSPLGRASAGGAFIFFGRRSWPRQLDLERNADIVIAGSRSGEGLSGHCDVGDFNRDGRLDLALVATDTTLWSMRQGRGRYYVFLGRPDWPRMLDTSPPARQADVRVEGERALAVNARPAFADVNGDSYADLVMLATHTMATPPGEAEIAILFGRAGPLPIAAARRDADLILKGDVAVPRVGPTLLARDLDDDGYDDLLFSEPRTGDLLTLLGRRTWPARSSFGDIRALALVRLRPSQGEGGLRHGDVDGDAIPEVVTTALLDPNDSRSGARYSVAASSRQISVDVRPGHEPNVLYVPGILVVRVAGASLPPDDPLDPLTARVAGVVASRGVWVEGSSPRDLLLYFETAGMRVHPNTTRVTLTARTRRGVPLRGSDTVVVQPGSPVSLTDRARRPFP